MDRAARCWPAPRGSCGSSPSPAPTSCSTRIVGSAGLGPTVVALAEGIDVALANKESLVVGGELVIALAEATGAQLIPVDSEHSALHQLLARRARPAPSTGSSLTASGGPFRGRTRAELAGRDASRRRSQHPTWAMGGKITIDSATLMNKGLEVIEAHHLFGTPYDRIDVVVHPQSIVHALVHAVRRRHARAPRPPRHARADRLRAAPPRARRRAGAGRSTSPRSARSTFEPPDLDAFPCLRARARGRAAGGTAPCVLNAANEVAVHAFLGGRLRLPRHPGGDRGHARAAAGRAACTRFESLYEADAEARALAGRAGRPGVRSRELVPRLRSASPR